MYDQLPDKLKKQGLFCNWRLEERNDRMTKVPYQINGKRANPTDRRCFTDFETACRSLDGGNGIGIGIFDDIAAIDIDSNGEATEEIILDLFGKRLRLSGQATVTDYKTKLQQLVQQDGNEELSYFVVSAVGPEHDKLFEVEARINSNVVGRGNGKSKRDAEQNAAREALLLFGLKL